MERATKRPIATLALLHLLTAWAVGALPFDPASDRVKIDTVLKQEVVTANCAVPHIVMGQGDLEGRIDCEGGKKADFRIGFGASTMPENLGSQRVAISVSPGLRTDGTGAAPSVGVKNPSGGNLLLDTSASAPVSMQVDPFAHAPTLAKYAQFTNPPGLP